MRVGHASTPSKEAASCHHGNHPGCRCAKADRAAKKNGVPESGFDLDVDPRQLQQLDQHRISGVVKSYRDKSAMGMDRDSHNKLLARYYQPKRNGQILHGDLKQYRERSDTSIPRQQRFKCPECGGYKRPESKLCLKCYNPEAYANPSGTRMRQVVTLIAEGLSIKDIASHLKISDKTVEYHWGIAKARLGFRSYVDAVKYAIRHHLIEL